MTDYSQAKIYKIECNITNEVYYGSTTLSLSQRITHHKARRDCSAIKIIDIGNFNIKVIEEYPCNSKKELEARERWYIENNLCVNERIPGRTRKEWREDNRDKILAQKKKYREANKVEIEAHNSTKIKCECGCEIRRNDLARHRRTKRHADLLGH